MNDDGEEMTDNEYLRNLVDEATHGPWTAHEGVVSAEWSGASGWSGPIDDRMLVADAGAADAEFIAASREAVPALLRQLEEAESERNLTALSLAQAVVRADKADAKVLAVEDALEEPEAMIGGELYISVDSVRRALSASGRD